ncbi:hypothetical protein PR001_g28706 [Phytophthora rubi]|uniref:Uncharacterized protein n=1 Tax=Phytophthora rubi TaxID=129364 RepID=A0A6A3H7A1_9STRA|nr:hypothetical protein PR001_g28706 [Phytophthora rubi]
MDAKLRASHSRCMLVVACMACMKVFILTELYYVGFMWHSGDEAGGGVQATDAKLRMSCSSGDGGIQAAGAKLRLHGGRIATFMSRMAGGVQAMDAKLRASHSSGDEAGGGVQATDAKLRMSCSSGDGGIQAAGAKLRLHGGRIATFMSRMAWMSGSANQTIYCFELSDSAVGFLLCNTHIT